ncbi:MAG TPA: hypothetical protein VHC49_17945 [Mycobacteriales bacterium]|nr:hypothetical protein [Mycobacteriales bacterium]
MRDEDLFSDPTAPPSEPEPESTQPVSRPVPPAPELPTVEVHAVHIPAADPDPAPGEPATEPTVTSTPAAAYLPPVTAPPATKRRSRHIRPAVTALAVVIFLGVVGWLVVSVGNRSGEDAPGKPKVDCPTGRVIDCRVSDPEPKIGKGEFTHNPMVTGSPFALIRHDLLGCAGGARGALLAAAERAGCNQVARSLYRSTDMALTTMVFNLTTDVTARQFSVAVRQNPALLRAIEHPVVKFPDLRQPHTTVAVPSGHFTMVIIGQYRDFHRPAASDQKFRSAISDAGQSLFDYIVARSFK